MSERIALVTGAGSGIGKAVSLALLRNGYSVVLAGRRQVMLEEVAHDADPENERTLCVPTDIGDPAAVGALFAATKEQFSHLDLLFNNAGTGAPAIPLEDITYEQWMTVVKTNLSGASHGSGDGLEKGGGVTGEEFGGGAVWRGPPATCSGGELPDRIDSARMAV